MTIQEVWDRARDVMGPKCRVCPECDGRACRGEIPGVGGIGSASSFTVCREYLSRVRLLMDLVYEPGEIDTSVELFGRRFEVPFFMAPIGGMGSNYNGYLTDEEFADISVRGMAECGSLAFTPDAFYDTLYDLQLPVIKAAGGLAIPTVKPWALPKLLGRIRQAEEVGAIAVACDIDSCGNLLLKKAGKPVYPLSRETMAEIVNSTPLPFIPKGILTAEAAVRCADAGCYGIVVSNHGGRVLEDTPAPCSMLPEIRRAVGGRLKIFVDGGIRSGRDVFKCLALGADAVLIGRPYAIAAHGGGREGVVLYSQKLLAELRDAMVMTGCRSLSDIDGGKIRIG
ncbi:MAG: alpha-hydroxy-acid oxidizing protein [Oscillospiraceae bacterium]|nr:alpha-hydroxy-acid oxidizing protein [Oscillospiraceae bacterium]